jgi:hypothetical protein
MKSPFHARGQQLLDELSREEPEAPAIAIDDARKAMVPSSPAATAVAPRRGKPISERAARELAMRLLSMKIMTNPEILGFRAKRAILMIAGGIKAAFVGRGIAIDAAAAEGIADALQEKIPGARDLLWTGAG